MATCHTLRIGCSALSAQRHAGLPPTGPSRLPRAARRAPQPMVAATRAGAGRRGAAARRAVAEAPAAHSRMAATEVALYTRQIASPNRLATAGGVEKGRGKLARLAGCDIVCVCVLVRAQWRSAGAGMGMQRWGREGEEAHRRGKRKLRLLEQTQARLPGSRLCRLCGRAAAPPPHPTAPSAPGTGAPEGWGWCWPR